MSLAGAVAFSPRRLRTAARSGNLEEVQRVVEKHGCSVDGLAVPRTGASLLLAASQAGHLAVVKWLLAQGADVNLARDDGSTPLLAACSKGHDACVAALIAAGADVNRSKANGTSPLTSAAQHGHFNVVRHLVAAGADVDQTALGGFSALYKAAQQGHVPTAAALLAAGADVNRAAPDGSTPLLTAAYIGNGLMVRELADYSGRHRVDISKMCTAPDGRMFTAVEAAEAAGHGEAVWILRLAELAPLMGAMQRLAWASCGHRRLGLSSSGYVISADMLTSVGLVTSIPVTATVERWEDRVPQKTPSGVSTGSGDTQDSVHPRADDATDDECSDDSGEDGAAFTPPRRRFNGPLLFGKYEKASPRPIPVPDTLTPLRSRGGSASQDSSPFPWDVNATVEGSILSSSPASIDYSSGGSSSGGDSESESEEACGSPMLPTPVPAHSPRQLVALELLRGKDCPDFVDRSRKEDYLSDVEFRYVFKLERQGFRCLSKRMQENAKKQAGLSDDRVDAELDNPTESELALSLGVDGSADDSIDESQLRWWSDQLLRQAAASEQREARDNAVDTDGHTGTPTRARQRYVSPFRSGRRQRSSSGSGFKNVRSSSASATSSSGYQSPFRRLPAGEHSSIFRTTSAKLLDEAQPESLAQNLSLPAGEQGTPQRPLLQQPTREPPAFARQLFDANDDDDDEADVTLINPNDGVAADTHGLVLEPTTSYSDTMVPEDCSEGIPPPMSSLGDGCAGELEVPMQMLLDPAAKPEPDSASTDETIQMIPAPLPVPTVAEAHGVALDRTDSSADNIALIKAATETAAEQAFKDAVVEQEADAALGTERSLEEATMSFKRFTSWFEEKHTASGSSVRMTSLELQVCRRIWSEVSDASNQVDRRGLQAILEQLLQEGAISISHSGHIVPTAELGA